MLLAILLASCGTTTGSSVGDKLGAYFSNKQQLPKELTGARFCDVAEPLSWDEGDTSETVVGIKAHNKVGVRLCGWGKK